MKKAQNVFFQFCFVLKISVFFFPIILLCSLMVNAQNLVNKSSSATITGSGTNITYLNDNNPSTDWYATYNQSNGNTLLATFASGVVLNGMGLSANGNGTESAAASETPKNFVLYGSTDNVTFTQLGSWTNIIWDRKGSTKIFYFNNTVAYKYYRLLINGTQANSGNVSLSEWQLFENLGISGIVYSRTSTSSVVGFGNVSGDKGLQGVNVSIVDENRNIVKTVQTDLNGKYVFSPSDIVNSSNYFAGDFSLIVTPLSGYRFVSDPQLTYTTYILNKYNHSRLQIQADGAFPFLSLETKSLSNFYNKRYVSNSRFTNTLTSLDFGLKASSGVNFADFYPTGYTASPTNLITGESNGTFGTLSGSPVNYIAAHPTQPAFNASLSQGGGQGLYGTLSNLTTGYSYNDKPYTPGSGHNGVLADGNYTVTNFLGGIQGDVSIVPVVIANGDATGDSTMIGNQLESYLGGWRKTYGATTGDVLDKYGVFNGYSSGGSINLTSTNVTLTAGKTYGLFFNAKSANSFTSNNATPPSSTTISVSVLNSSGTSISSGTLSLSKPTSVAEDEPGSAWDYKYLQFTISTSGTYSVSMSASGSGYNDFYLDNLGVFELVSSVNVSGTIVNSDDGAVITGINNMFAYLTNNSGTVLSRVKVGTDGSYLFSDAPSGTSGLSVSVSTDSLLVGATLNQSLLPDGYTIPNNATKASSSLFSTTTTDLSGITVALQKSITLPITLSSFGGIMSGNYALLKWTTSSEINSKLFNVERSVNNGKIWTTIGSVSAKGNSSKPEYYTYTDMSPSSNNLYRLRLVDIDLSYAYSSTVALQGTEASYMMAVYPNPASNLIKVDNVKDGMVLQIFSGGGQLVRTLRVNANPQWIDIAL